MAYKDKKKQLAMQLKHYYLRRRRLFRGKKCEKCGSKKKLVAASPMPLNREIKRAKKVIWGCSDTEKQFSTKQILCRKCADARKRKPIAHGTTSGYKNYGCKCEDCRRAYNEQQKGIREEKKMTVAKRRKARAKRLLGVKIKLLGLTKLFDGFQK